MERPLVGESCRQSGGRLIPQAMRGLPGGQDYLRYWCHLRTEKGKQPQRTRRYHRGFESTFRCGPRVLCGEPRLVFPVDLRFLQLVGVIDVDRLPLRVEVDCADAALAVSVASGLGTAEGQMDLRTDRGRID